MLLALLVAASLQAQDPPGFWDRDAVLGDWGGVRTSLADVGITNTVGFTGEVLSNISGGVDRDTGADRLLDWVIDADFNRMFGWTGGSARFNPMVLAGDGISDDLGDLTRVSNIAGRGGARIFQLWLQQALFDGVLSLRAGMLSGDLEFTVTGQGLLYYNSAFGAPVFISANLAWPAYPVGALGAQVRVEPTARTYVKAAIYDGHPGTEDFNRSGLRSRVDHDEGVFMITEAGWTFGGDCPGILKAGAFYHSDDVVASSSGLGGGYALYEQKIYREGPIPGMLDVFVRVGAAQERKAVVSLGVDAGMNFTGVIPGRPLDVLGFGFIYARISRDYAATQPEPQTYGYEAVFEGTYKLMVTPAWSLQPGVQYLWHPGGNTRVHNATVIGIRTDVNF